MFPYGMKENIHKSVREFHQKHKTAAITSIYVHDLKKIRKKVKNETYLFVAVPHHDIKKPMIKKTVPCIKPVDGSYGKNNNVMAPNGTPMPELNCAKIILPVFGKCLEKISPNQPPNNPPKEVEAIKAPIIVAVTLCENPVNSSHIGANDKAAHGKVPAMPCATIAKNVGIFTTNFALLKVSLSADGCTAEACVPSANLQ